MCCEVYCFLFIIIITPLLLLSCHVLVLFIIINGKEIIVMTIISGFFIIHYDFLHFHNKVLTSVQFPRLCGFPLVLHSVVVKLYLRISR